MSLTVTESNTVQHFVVRPWPQAYAPLIHELSGAVHQGIEKSPNLHIGVVSSGGIWDLPRLIEPLSASSDTGVIAHAWHPAIAEAIVTRPDEDHGPLVVQCDRAADLNVNSPLIGLSQSGAVIRFVATSDETAERLAAIGIVPSTVSVIPWVNPPHGQAPSTRAVCRARWRFAERDIVVSVLPSDTPGAMYAVAWAAFLVHEAAPNLRLLMASANRDQRRSERMASGCGKAGICRFLAGRQAQVVTADLIAAADLVVLPIGTHAAEEYAFTARRIGTPILDVADVLHPAVDHRPDTEHPFHDLAAELLTRIDALPAEKPNDHAAQTAAWSQQVAEYRRLYAELLSAASV